MKKLIVFLLLFAACKTPFDKKGNGSFPGIYVREIHDEFTTGQDTLIIQDDHPFAGGYSIEKRMRYRQVIDKRQLAVQYNIVKWSALPDETTGELTERKEGRTFRLNREGDQLLMGSIIYNRVK